MKPSKNIFGKIFTIAISLFITEQINAQPDKATVKTSVESKQFIFHAQTAMPSSGRSRQLTSEDDLRIFPDSLVANLLTMVGPIQCRTAQAAEGLILLQQNLIIQLHQAKREDGI